ncbi:MAG: hypothetical protein WB985_07660 [Candidatus Acidiferrales bacterium]
MSIDTKGLTLLVAEADALSQKATLTKAEQRRSAFLMSAISAVKAGVTLADIELERLNEVEDRNGFRRTVIERANETDAKAFFMRKLVEVGDSRELRSITTASTEGSLLSMIGTYTGLGYFVPTRMFGNVFSTMKQHDFLYDEDKVTVVKTKDASPMHVPTFSDVANVAVQVSEATNTFGNRFSSDAWFLTVFVPKSRSTAATL